MRLGGRSAYQRMASQSGTPLQYIGRTYTKGGSGIGIVSTGGTQTPTRRAPTPAAPPTAPPAAGAGGAAAVAGGSEIMDLYRQALERLSGGGLALEASLADIEAGKEQAIARGQQAMVSGGLAGTTGMGGVSVAAERGAGRARLAARGQAEEKYLGTLMSFAGFSQRAQEAAAERQAAMQRLQTQLASQERLAGRGITSQERMTEQRLAATGGPWPEAPVGGPTYMASRMPTPSIKRGPIGSGYYGDYTKRFPSIYGEAEQQAPSLM